ncbi:hypothetical protein [Marisediminicola sp. LYQ85]|uniref:hypothetical protein n=1 Tax=Marisediminicola sp. LYQ85 TaxID=3391062 RepID=UPI003983AB64
MLRKGPPIDLTALTTASTAATTLLGVVVALLVDFWWGRASAASIGRAAIATAIGWTAFLLAWAGAGRALDGALVLPLAAVSGLAAVLVSTPAHIVGLSPHRTYGVVAAWSLLVYSPITLVAFTTVSGFFATGYVPLDLAGALPGLVAAGASGAAFLLVTRDTDRAFPPGVDRRSRVRIVLLFAVLWALWLVWMLGLELAITTASPRILLNGLLAPVAAAVAWLVVQRIRRAETTLTAALGGLYCGLVAIAPAGGYIDSTGAIVTGATAGAVCSLLGYHLARTNGQASWLPTIQLLVGGTIGAVLVGVFAIRSGLVVMGQPETILSQLASAGSAIGLSFVVSLVLWSIATRGGRRARVDTQ